MAEKKSDEEELKFKKRIGDENKQLKIFLIGMGAIIVLVLAGALIVHNIRNFEINGVTFNVVKEQDLIFYRTSFPANYYGKSADYNFYIRNNPKTLKKEISFEGELAIKDFMVINISGSDDNFNCDGDGVIAMANLVKFYEFLGSKVMRDENATCDSEGKYMFVRIIPAESGNVSSIKKVGPACYDLFVDDCDVLKVTERFMLEAFEKVNEEWV